MGPTIVHSFRIIPKCPVSLLGRGLMGILQISVRATPEGGLRVESSKMNIFCPENPIYLAKEILADVQEIPVNPKVWSDGPLDGPLADKVAKTAATTQEAQIAMSMLTQEISLLDHALIELQKHATDEDLKDWGKEEHSEGEDEDL